jgi:hypothetical protein
MQNATTVAQKSPLRGIGLCSGLGTSPQARRKKGDHMQRLGFIGLTVACLIAGDAHAQYSNAPPPFVSNLLNGILRSMPMQPGVAPQPAPAQPGYVPAQPGYVQQAAPPPNPQAQQQIDEERRQAAAAAEERARQRQQADADARAKQRQAELKAQADAKAKADADERRRREAANKLRANPALVAVLGSDPRDITALIAGRDTQVVIRNLKGDPIFQSAPIACFPFGGLTTEPGSPEMRFLSSVIADIAQKGGLAGAPITPKLCDPPDIAGYDLVIFSSSQVATGSSEVLSALVNALGSRQLVTFGTFTVANFDAGEKAKVAAAQAEKAKNEAERQAARESFQSRDPTVISGISLESPATVVCLMTSPDTEGVRYMLKRNDSPFVGLVNANSAILEKSSADAIFLALKKHDCLAAIAPAGALKDVVAALARDNVVAEIHGGTLDRDRLANWKVLAEQDLLAEQADQAKRLKAQREADTKQKAEDEERQTLEAERQKNDETARQQKILEMRKLVESKANAVVDGFADKLRDYMTTVQDEITTRKPPSRQALSIFQPWASQYVTQIKQGWEFQAINATVEDYGRAQWKARTIEAISMKVEFPMLNRAIGEKKTDCVDFVWVNDEEFGFRRNPITVSCDMYASVFAAWSEQNTFTSQWTLLQ